MAYFRRRAANARLTRGLFTHPALASWFTAEEVERLIADGADPNLVLPDRQCPLSRACAWGNKPIAQVLLRHGADPNGNRFRRSIPLIAAAANGHIDLIRLLVDHGAEVNAQSDSGETALHRALISDVARRRQVPEVLLELGADRFLKNHDGLSAYGAFYYHARDLIVEKATLVALDPRGNAQAAREALELHQDVRRYELVMLRPYLGRD